MGKGKSLLKRWLVLVALALPASLSAAEITTLVVEFKNGQEPNKFILSDKPVMTMAGKSLMIDSETMAAAFPRSVVARFYFVGVGTSIDDVMVAKDAVTFSQVDKDRLVISNLVVDSQVTVCDLSGRFFNSCVARHGSEAVVDLCGCPRGVYIIKIGKEQTIKLTKK